MPRIKVVIIEDEFFAANHLNDLVTELGFWVVGVFHSGEDFLKQTNWDFDTAIVDIFLSDKLSGLEVAEQLKGRQKPFLFLTANQDSQTLKDAARLGPTAYISKPFKPNDVAAALEIVAHKRPQMLQIRGSAGMEELNPNDVLFIKSDSVYIELYTLTSMIVQRKLLKEILEELPASFVRVHRSYVVNENYIDQRKNSHLIVRGHEVPISRSFKEGLKE